MTVFKNYFKVAKKYFGIILMYSIIFIVIAVISSSSNSNDITKFESIKTKIAVIDNDNSEFIKEFEKYVSEKSTIVEIKDDENSMKDALFFKKVDYIMVIPKNFTNDFIAGKDIKIQTMQVPDSYSAIYSKTLMNDYLNTANSYLKAGISQNDVTKYVKDSLSKQAKVTMLNEDNQVKTPSAVYFYNSLSYIILSVIISVIAMIMISFNDDKIRKRNLVSNLSYKNINKQLILGNIVISLMIWLLYILISFILYSETMLTINGLLMIVNSGLFLFFALSFAFFVANLVSNREAINGISNVVGLGCSFIAGAFVPQELLGGFVLVIARFTPSYWYIKGNNEIIKLTQFNFDTLQPILFNMFIIMIFIISCYFLIQFVSKLKLKK